MITNGIFTIEFNRGKLRLNLPYFLPCSKTNLQKVCEMINRAEEPETYAAELSEYIRAEFTAAQERGDSKTAQKYAAGYETMQKAFPALDLPALPESGTAPKLKKGKVYTSIYNNGAICAEYPGYIFTYCGIKFGVYRQTAKHSWQVILLSCGLSCGSCDKKDDAVKTVRGVLDAIKNYVKSAKYPAAVSAFHGIMKDGYTIFDGKTTAPIGRGKFDSIPDDLPTGADTQPATATATETATEGAESSDNGRLDAETETAATAATATDDAPRKEFHAAKIRQLIAFDEFIGRIYGKRYDAGDITREEMINLINTEYEQYLSRLSPADRKALDDGMILNAEERGALTYARTAYKTDSYTEKDMTAADMFNKWRRGSWTFDELLRELLPYYETIMTERAEREPQPENCTASTERAAERPAAHRRRDRRTHSRRTHRTPHNAPQPAGRADMPTAAQNAIQRITDGTEGKPYARPVPARFFPGSCGVITRRASRPVWDTS